MDYKTFYHIQSLLKTVEKRKELAKIFAEMAKDTRSGKLGRYYRMFSLKDWWYLVFRTYRGRGAFLFLKVLGKNLTDDELWEFIADCENWDEEDNEVGPYPFPPITPD